MNFSQRTNWDLTENDFTAAVRAARAAGRELLDLTVSDPTACGFRYTAESLLAPLVNPAAMLYEPSSLGMPHAREAVAQYYVDHGARVSTDHICLTTSTSEAYSFLFRLLCDPGDEVLIARPSYPLFDFIARLDDVRLAEYPLVYDGGWQIDFHRLKSAITRRTRAIVVVHPNNPTGNYAAAWERAALDEICARHKIALIVDEVFLDYPVSHAGEPSFLTVGSKALTFVLSGISKVCALPQMKLSWVVANGPRELVESALSRLELIADTFLSVNAPMQYALPEWLASCNDIQLQIRERVTANLSLLAGHSHGSQANLLAMDGGWIAVLRVPRYVQGVAFAAKALEQGVVVQPGEFYGLSAGHIVLSLLTPPEIWQAGIATLQLHLLIE